MRFRLGPARNLRLVVAALTAACLAAAAGQAAGAELQVMTFNIWLGGDQVSLTRVIDAIEAAEADVVLLQEAEGQTRALADALGWPYASPRHHAISRVPLFDPDTRGNRYLYAELEPGGFVALANVHLTSDPYGPYAARAGRSAARILRLERETRLPEIRPILRTLRPVVRRGTPVVIAGDFNAPSHLDWTPATVGARPHVRFALPWPVSLALERAGYRDTYREAHPDPEAAPGITWTAGYPHPHLRANEAVDRIDQIHAGGPAATLASRLVGPGGVRDVEVAVDPWPSDHLGVVSTLAVEPGPAPAMVALAQRRVRQGQVLEVRFHAATPDGRLENGRIAVVRAGRSPAAALMTRATNNTTDRNSLVPLGTTGLAAGDYDAVLVGPRGAELARTGFWVVARGARPQVSTDRQSYAPGEPITVRWRAAPGDRFDWIGLYRAGEPDQEAYLAFAYTGATVAASARFDRAAIGGVLPAGSYEARLMRDDGYAVLATAPFVVERAG